jgi:hypothetical protein
LSGEEARTTQLAGEEYGVPSERDDPREKPIWLQHVNRERDEWELVDTINNGAINAIISVKKRGIECGDGNENTW